MKWIALLAAAVVIVPFAGWLRRHPRELPKIWVLVGFLPFAIGGVGIGSLHLYMAVISWPGWPGYAKGIEISVLDLLVISLFFSLPRSSAPLPFRWPMVLYLIAVLLSALQATEPMATFFYAWQVIRMILLYVVVARGCADRRVIPALLTGMALGLGLEACLATYQRFVLGILQPGGSFGHQNFLGLVTHFVVFPWIVLLFAGERGFRTIVGPFFGLIIAVLTVSRATVGLAAIGYAALYLLSVLRSWTPRKAVLLIVGVGGLVALAPFTISSFEKRFTQEPLMTGGYDERAAFTKAALLIISDFPLGVGANSYVVVANTEGYNTRGGVAPIIGSDSANVHNIYLLVTAETGYLGLVTFLLMILQPMLVAFRCGFMYPKDLRGDLLIGLGMSLLIIYIHSYFEWILVTFAPQYMFAIDAGMIAGLSMQLGYWRASPATNVTFTTAISDVAPKWKVFSRR